MKTPIERITDYINDRDSESRNPISLLKELRARIVQDNNIQVERVVIPQTKDENFTKAELQYLHACMKCWQNGLKPDGIDDNQLPRILDKILKLSDLAV